MAECGICGQDKPAKRTDKVYTVIQQQVTRKIGFKQYETKTKYLCTNSVTYSICADCIRRYRGYSWVFWLSACFVIAPLIAWLLYPKGQGQGSETMELCMFSALSPIFILLLASFIWVIFLNLQRKLIKKAVEAREATDWQGELVGLPNFVYQPIKGQNLEVLGFTEAGFKSLQKKK